MRKKHTGFEYRNSDFDDIFAKLDQNNDEEIELTEMIDFVNSRLTVESDLIIAVYWIGYHVKPKDFEQF